MLLSITGRLYIAQSIVVAVYVTSETQLKVNIVQAINPCVPILPYYFFVVSICMLSGKAELNL